MERNLAKRKYNRRKTKKATSKKSKKKIQKYNKTFKIRKSKQLSKRTLKDLMIKEIDLSLR